jgi:hypothetical protein
MYGRGVRDEPPPIYPRTEPFTGFALAHYDNARQLVGIERYAAAVLLAQAAVEMGTRNALVGMLVDRYGELSDDEVKQLLPGSLSFLEDDCRVLWKALTGERVSRPKDPPVWPSYEQHVHYRNAIAHGSTWGDSWGFESVAAAGQFILRLDQHMVDYYAARPDL